MQAVQGRGAGRQTGRDSITGIGLDSTVGPQGFCLGRGLFRWAEWVWAEARFRPSAWIGSSASVRGSVASSRIGSWLRCGYGIISRSSLRC